MYNRYTPQPDGTYQKNRMPDHIPGTPSSYSPAPSPPGSDTPGGKPEGILGFFRKLLPKELDTGDLIIILLMLLIANDCQEDRTHALLTLALYFLL